VEFKDYYKTLEVSKTATQEEIKKAFRQKARQYHPDRNPDNPEAEEMFKAANEAYEVLSDEENRRKYDQIGSNWKQYSNSGAAGQQSQYDPFNSRTYKTYQQRGPNDRSSQGNDARETVFGDFSDVSDFFKTFFSNGGGTAQRSTTARAPKEHRAQFTISLADAYIGCVKQISYNGQSIKLTLKRGIADEQILRVKGIVPSMDSHSPKEDLKLRIRIQKDNVFERKDNDLHTEHKISAATAAIGGHINLTLIDGSELKITVPAGTQPDNSLRIRRKGMPLFGQTDRFGDLLIHIKVEIPRALTDEQRKLYEQLELLEQKS